VDAKTQAILSRIRAPLKGVPMMAEIIDIEVGVSDAGRTQIVARIAPVYDDKPQPDLALRYYLGLPEEGEKNPQVLGRARDKGYGFFSSVNPSFPRRPRKLGKEQFRLKNGEVVTYKQSLTAQAAVDEAIFDGLAAIRVGGTAAVKSLRGTRVFMCPQVATFDTETLQTSQFVKFIADELRDGQSYLTSDFVDTDKQAEFLQAAGL